MTTEPPVYRPFALAALAATLAGGTPLGIWLASWLYLGAPAVPISWILLHAHLQIVGFFGVLIPGVAHHLLARFAGHPVTGGPVKNIIFGLLVGGLLSRLLGTWADQPALIVVASCLEAAGFVLFGLRVWRSLDAPSLGLLRGQLTTSTAWFALACLVEAVLRAHALHAGLTLPDVGGLRAAHAMALYGGVLGWVLGVLVRAGPMFVPGWRAPVGMVRALPWLLGLGVAVAAGGEAATWAPTTGVALARLGEFIALASVGAVLAMGGVVKPHRGLPMIGRSGAEARIFRLAVISAGLAVIGAAAATVAAFSGAPAPLLTDAVRHLMTIGLLTSVVIAMAFRLIPVLEGTALPWPRLRGVAFWALVMAVVLRSAEIVVGHGWSGPAPWVPLSGLLVWLALASVAANLLKTILRNHER